MVIVDACAGLTRSQCWRAYDSRTIPVWWSHAKHCVARRVRLPHAPRHAQKSAVAANELLNVTGNCILKTVKGSTLVRPVLLAFLLVAAPMGAQRSVQFDVTEEFLRSWAARPVAALPVRLDCASKAHNAPNDCELHVGAKLADPEISDHQWIVLEPPNVCKHPGAKWRSTINKHRGEDCTATGFLRAWPEHLSMGQGCSNPEHFLEVHPLLSLSCGTTTYDFTSMLRADSDLGSRPALTVANMLELKLWVCRGCTGAEDVATIAFDYCFGNPCTRGRASNFARFNARVVRDTIRVRTGKARNGYATAIARVTHADDTPKTMTLLKVYAIKGTDFYNELLTQHGKTGTVPTWDILGIFAIDPTSVLRTIDRASFRDIEWVPVTNPVTFIVFGRL
jgi:hypothetical protein